MWTVEGILQTYRQGANFEFLNNYAKPMLRHKPLYGQSVRASDGELSDVLEATARMVRVHAPHLVEALVPVPTSLIANDELLSALERWSKVGFCAHAYGMANVMRDPFKSQWMATAEKIEKEL